MSTTPYAAAAGAARQRLATSLGTLQQDPNVPPPIPDIIAGLARALGPLFQLERGSTDTSLFVQARAVLQETLGKMQAADQGYPGVADATGAIAQSLSTIFQAMRDAGLVPAPGGAAPAPAPASPSGVVLPPTAQAPAPAPPVAKPPTPPAGAKRAPDAAPPRAAQQAALRAAPTTPGTPGALATAGSVPIGPRGLPRMEAEVGVHSETNFYTDFLGDIRNHGGIFVATFNVLSIGAEVEVALTFPGNLTAEMRGVVKWRREAGGATASMSASPGLGIEITNAPAEAWNLIDRFMRRREPIMYEI